MKLVRLEKAWRHQIKEALDNYGIKNSAEVAEVLDQRFTVLKFKKKEKQHPLWRLTAPLFFIALLLILISIPFNYLATGKAQYEFESAIGRFYRAWQIKLGL